MSACTRRSVAGAAILSWTIAGLLNPAAHGAEQGPVGSMGPVPGGGFAYKNAIPSRYAVLIKDGVYVPQQLPNTTVTGKIDGHSASAVHISSRLDWLNGVYVTGAQSKYQVSDAQVDLSGNGSDDMAGIGAGFLVGGGAQLTLRHVKVTTWGVISSATTATDGATLRVYDSELIAHGSALPKSYVAVIGPGMMQPPAPLLIDGTARATNVTNHARAYYYHTTITADGWGALSTDMANGHVYLEADDCTIQTLKSGYGTYADTGAQVVINRSKMDVASYLGIIAGSGSMALNDLAAQSRNLGVMIHDVMGSTDEIGRIRMRGGAVHTSKAVILVRSANANIELEHVDLKSDAGVLIQSVVSDDPNATKVNGKSVSGIHATLKQMNAEGSILHEDTDRPMALALVASQIKGEILNATLTLDPMSHWTATADSKVTLRGTLKLSQLDAATGVTITASVPAGSSLAGQHMLASGGVLNATAA